MRQHWKTIEESKTMCTVKNLQRCCWVKFYRSSFPGFTCNLVLWVVCLPNETSLNETTFSFPNSYQLEIVSWLGMWYVFTSISSSMTSNNRDQSMPGLAALVSVQRYVDHGDVEYLDFLVSFIPSDS